MGAGRHRLRNRKGQRHIVTSGDRRRGRDSAGPRITDQPKQVRGGRRSHDRNRVAARKPVERLAGLKVRVAMRLRQIRQRTRRGAAPCLAVIVADEEKPVALAIACVHDPPARTAMIPHRVKVSDHVVLGPENSGPRNSVVDGAPDLIVVQARYLRGPPSVRRGDDSTMRRLLHAPVYRATSEHRTGRRKRRAVRRGCTRIVGPEGLKPGPTERTKDQNAVILKSPYVLYRTDR
jgi:hypothetical protein